MKPYVYAPIPEFDQETKYITQMAPIDMGDHYFVGIEIHRIENQDNTEESIE
jgi:hypothetical protein